MSEQHDGAAPSPTEERVAQLELEVRHLRSALVTETEETTRFRVQQERRWAAHAREHARLNAEIEKVRKANAEAIGEAYEFMGVVGRDLGGKADVIRAQAAKLGDAGKTLERHAWFQSKLGLLVILGAAVGGGVFQGAVSLWGRPAPAPAPVSVPSPPR